MDKSLQYRAEQTLSNFGLTDDEVNQAVGKWSDIVFPEDARQDMVLAKLERIAQRIVLERLGTWKSFKQPLVRRTRILRSN